MPHALFLYVGPSGKAKLHYEVCTIWNQVHLFAMDLRRICGRRPHVSSLEVFKPLDFWGSRPLLGLGSQTWPGTVGNDRHMDLQKVFHIGQKGLCYFPCCVYKYHWSYNIVFTEIIKLDLFYIECVCVFLLKTWVFFQHVSNISQEIEPACDRNLINYS